MLTSHALILGIIQGVTEFVPISSTAHLTLAGRLMGLVRADNSDRPEDWTAFIAVIQMGTLLAALIYLSPDVIRILNGFARTNLALLTRQNVSQSEGDWARLGWLLIVASVPIGIAGLVFRRRIRSKRTKNLHIIVLSMLVVAILLAIGEATGSQAVGLPELGFPRAIVVGVSQTLALVPGASRSGTTIATGLLVGLNREAAARFSFLLMIPAVGASGLLNLPSALRSINAGVVQILAGIAGAGVSGYLAVGLMLGYLQKHTIYPFVAYRLVLAAVISGLLFSRRLKSRLH
jgi:undecaprenyl-diphosphatase